MSRELYKAKNGETQPVLGFGDLTTDAWGKQKAVLDRSLVHGMFTFSVPSTAWNEFFNGTERALTSATSLEGKLNLTSGATINDDTLLCTFRHPRYQPNRGHLYSSSMIFPSPEAIGERDFGSMTPEAGFFFRLKDGLLYAVCRTTVASVTTEMVDLIEEVPSSVDLSKGNIFDIQMQWRGVGNVLFFIGNPITGVSELVHCMKLLGTLTELSVFNPALPVSFHVKNTDGTAVVIQCGCVDITSEGGTVAQRTYGSVSTSSTSGSVAITGFNIPMLVLHNKTSFGTLVNTRDFIMLNNNAWADQKSFFRYWRTRDTTAITDPVYTDFREGHMEYAEYDPGAGTPMTFDTTKASLEFGNRVAQDIPFSKDELFDNKTEIYMSPGDYLIYTMHRETGMAANAGCTIEFAEEV